MTSTTPSGRGVGARVAANPLGPVTESLESLRAEALRFFDRADRGLDGTGLLDAAQSAQVLADRFKILGQALAHRAEAASAHLARGATRCAELLASNGRTSLPQARRAVAEGRDLAAAPVLEKAALAGGLTPGQAKAAATALKEVEGLVPAESREQLEGELVDAAAGLTPRAAAQAARKVVDRFAADAGLARAERMEREHLRAVKERFFSVTPDGPAQVRLTGSLPAADGERLRRALQAGARSLRAGGRDSIGDGCGGRASWGQLMADALAELASQATGASAKGSDHREVAQDAACDHPGGADCSGGRHGWRRPVTELVVTVGLEELRAGVPAGRAGALADGLPVSELRRLACEAAVVPMVLGSRGAVLDVGRRTRSVPEALRRLLEARDSGCVFPGCMVPAEACDAHHVEPWWAGGRTNASNLVLCCRRHHGMLEPLTRLGPDGRVREDQDRWRAAIDADGLPTVIPPVSVDRTRKPRRHERFAVPLHASVTDPPTDGFEWTDRGAAAQGSGAPGGGRHGIGPTVAPTGGTPLGAEGLWRLTP